MQYSSLDQIHEVQQIQKLLEKRWPERRIKKAKRQNKPRNVHCGDNGGSNLEKTHQNSHLA